MFNTFRLNDLSFCKMENISKDTHKSLLRLYDVAGVGTPMELANLLNESPQTINNWAARGVSKQGAINASQKIHGCDVNYILKGGTKPNLNRAAQDLSAYKETNDAITLPVLNITASMGDGSDNENELVIDMLRVSKSWIENTLNSVTNIKNIAFIHAIGDSMSPTFGDGDILLVDSGNTTITSDKIYVIEAHNRLFIKRIRQRVDDGVYEISSDNPAVKTVDVLNGGSEVIVKGRVIWVWNGRKV